MSEMNLVAEPGKHAITFTRLFDAPRDLVFKTYTDRHAVPQWWGPGSHKTVVDKMEVKPGGMWRYVSRGPDGNEYAFHGVYHLVVKPAQLVSTFEFEGLPERHVSLETANFETQADGGTRLTGISVFQSVADRDAQLKAGMEEGLSESMDRLAALLDELKAE